MTPAIDVHTHMLNRDWLELLRAHGRPRYELRKSLDAPEGIFLDGAPFMTPQPGHFDYPYRIRQMDEAGVDLAIISLTCPNVYWGGRDVSLKAAQVVNDDMAGAQLAYPSRIRWLCSLPWEHPEVAVPELARASTGARWASWCWRTSPAGPSTDPLFGPVWAEIDRRALPVLVHPTAPPGTPDMALREFNLIASIGFMFDTSLAIARLMFDGFLDRYPDVKLIVSHAGGALPYLVGRLDQCFDKMNAARTKTSTPPGEYMRRLYYDSVTYRSDALAMCIDVGGADRVLYGSDYPHNIGDMKGCLARVDALPAGQRDAVRGRNAQRLFGSVGSRGSDTRASARDGRRRRGRLLRRGARRARPCGHVRRPRRAPRRAARARPHDPERGPLDGPAPGPRRRRPGRGGRPVRPRAVHRQGVRHGAGGPRASGRRWSAETTVLTLQNGVESGDRLGAVLGADRVLVGTTLIATTIAEPGVIDQTNPIRRIELGEPSGEVTPRLESVAAALRDAGVEVRVTTDVRRAVWEKFIRLAPGATLATACRATIGQVRSTPGRRGALPRPHRRDRRRRPGGGRGPCPPTPSRPPSR